MERDSIILTPNEIVEHVFSQSVKGYDAAEVDAYLDRIVRDYEAFFRYQLDADEYIKDLESQLRKEKETNAKLTLDLAKAENRVKGIKDFSAVDSSNIDLLQYIARLENKLYSLGVTDLTALKH